MLAWLGGAVVAAEPQGDAEAALKILTELGVPDTRGATWVRARFADDPDESGNPHQLPAVANARSNGNAWLIREAPDQTVELIVRQTQRVWAKRIREDDDPEKAVAGTDLKPVIIDPADLPGDLTVIQAALEAFAKAAEDPGGGPFASFELPRHPAAAGQALLLLAHLQQQGRDEIVRRLLPQALLRGEAGEQEIDAAIHSLAAGRLEELSEQWMQTGNATAYAEGLVALATRFEHRWKGQSAARALAQRVREPAATLAGSDAAAIEAAALLMSLRPSDLPALPLGWNWVLPHDPSRPRRDNRDSEPRGPWRNSWEKTSGRPAVIGFFKKRDLSARALLPLLTDRRLLRLARPKNGLLEPEDAGGEEAVEKLPRPYEMRELVFDLLESLLPGRMLPTVPTRTMGAAESAIRTWVPGLAGKSDEEMAWAVVEATREGWNYQADEMLAYLVQHGSPATLERLQGKLLDPATWAAHWPSGFSDTLKVFIARLGPAARELGPKLIEVVKTVGDRKLRAQKDDPLPFTKLIEATEAEHALRLRELAEVARQHSIPEMLAEYASAKPADRESLEAAMATALRVDGSGAGAAVIYRAAAVAPQKQKEGLLTLIRESRGGPIPAPAVNAAIFTDTATRNALVALLHDETAVSEPGLFFPTDSTIGSWTAETVLPGQLSPEEKEQWEAMETVLPVARRWGRGAALALVAGLPRPRPPDADLVPAEAANKLIDSWSDLAPAKIGAAFRELTDDQQLAVARALNRREAWPKPLVEAQLTLVHFQPGEDEAFPLAAWMGRRFDEKLRGEMLAELERQARHKHYYSLLVFAESPLSGLEIRLVEKPDALRSIYLMGARVGAMDSLPRANELIDSIISYSPHPADFRRCIVARPLWIDEATSARWTEENPAKFPVALPLGSLRESTVAAPLAGFSRNTFSLEPAAYVRLLHRIEHGEPRAINNFRVLLDSSEVEPLNFGAR